MSNLVNRKKENRPYYLLHLQPTCKEEREENIKHFSQQSTIACPNCISTENMQYKQGMIGYSDAEENTELYTICGNCGAKHFVNSLGLVVEIVSDDVIVTAESKVKFKLANYNENFINSYGEQYLY